jgi:hypothetical protein
LRLEGDLLSPLAFLFVALILVRLALPIVALLYGELRVQAPERLLFGRPRFPLDALLRLRSSGHHPGCRKMRVAAQKQIQCGQLGTVDDERITAVVVRLRRLDSDATTTGDGTAVIAG